MRQANLFKAEPPVYGGSFFPGRRKRRRPLSRGRPIHVTLKSRRILIPARRHLGRELERLAEKFQISLYGLAIAGDHIHFVVKIPDRRAYVAFIRSYTGLMARKFGKGLWHLLPFTRVGYWGKCFQGMLAYVRKNQEETNIQRSYEPRKDWYGKLRRR